MIVEGKNYVNGYHFCNRLSPRQNFVALHHTIIWRKAAFVCWLQRVPTKCGADLRAYQSCSLVGWIWPANCRCSFLCCCNHSGMPEHLDCILETAGTQQALGIWRIYSGPVGFCGSTAGQLDLADPLFYMCLFADLLRIHCGPGRRSIWADYCMPVVFCGSTAGQLDLAEPLCFTGVCLRIYCGSTAGP